MCLDCWIKTTDPVAIGSRPKGDQNGIRTRLCRDENAVEMRSRRVRCFRVRNVVRARIARDFAAFYAFERKNNRRETRCFYRRLESFRRKSLLFRAVTRSTGYLDSNYPAVCGFSFEEKTERKNPVERKIRKYT